jgi:hypothetical protein
MSLRMTAEPLIALKAVRRKLYVQLRTRQCREEKVPATLYILASHQPCDFEYLFPLVVDIKLA